MRILIIVVTIFFSPNILAFKNTSWVCKIDKNFDVIANGRIKDYPNSKGNTVLLEIDDKEIIYENVDSPAEPEKILIYRINDDGIWGSMSYYINWDSRETENKMGGSWSSVEFFFNGKEFIKTLTSQSFREMYNTDIKDNTVWSALTDGVCRKR